MVPEYNDEGQGGNMLTVDVDQNEADLFEVVHGDPIGGVVSTDASGAVVNFTRGTTVVEAGNSPAAARFFQWITGAISSAYPSNYRRVQTYGLRG